VKIWDRRYLNKKSPEPVCNLVHPKGLSSAFFSPAGKYVVTTCNDDRLRVYDVTNMLTTRPNGTLTQVIYFCFWTGRKNWPRSLQYFGFWYYWF